MAKDDKPAPSEPLGALSGVMRVTLVPESEHLAVALDVIGEALMNAGVGLQDAATALRDNQDAAVEAVVTDDPEEG